MRLIDADALIEKIECLFKALNSTEDYMGIGYNHGVGECMAIAKNIPTIKAEPVCEYWDSESHFCALHRPAAEPVKRGKWIKHKDRACWYCSECVTDDYYAYSWNSDTGIYDMQDKYCPNCGAKMENKSPTQFGQREGE